MPGYDTARDKCAPRPGPVYAKILADWDEGRKGFLEKYDPPHSEYSELDVPPTNSSKWWAEYHERMAEEEMNWGFIRKAMGRGRCRVVVKWEEIDARDPWVMAERSMGEFWGSGVKTSAAVPTNILSVKTWASLSAEGAVQQAVELAIKERDSSVGVKNSQVAVPTIVPAKPTVVPAIPTILPTKRAAVGMRAGGIGPVESSAKRRSLGVVSIESSGVDDVAVGLDADAESETEDEEAETVVDAADGVTNATQTVFEATRRVPNLSTKAAQPRVKANGKGKGKGKKNKGKNYRKRA